MHYLKITINVVVSFILFTSCDLNLDNEQSLTYKSESIAVNPAPWLLNNSLNRGEDHKIEIDNPAVAATVYGNESDPNVYLAVGGEKLPNGSWVDNIDQLTYVTHIKNNAFIKLEFPVEIQLINPVETYYLSESEEWVNISAGSSVYASAIKTGNSGSCTLISTVMISEPGDDELNH